jgi:hypothetical protein
MSLLSKVKQARMKDPVEGVLTVAGITTPDPTATQTNYRLDGVVSAEGLEPTAIVHHGMTSVSHWPSVGQQLPVTVDRAKPDRIVIHWEQLKTSRQQAVDAAQQLAEQMRLGGSNPAAPPGAAPVAPATSHPTVSAADILATGTPGTATLLGTFQVDVDAGKPEHTMLGLTLNVSIGGAPPYQVDNAYAVPNPKLSALTLGVTLPVKAIVTVPGMVAVDWERVS